MNETASPSILLVGAGRMGGALLRGWLAAGIPPEFVRVREPYPSLEMSQLLAELGIDAEPDGTPDVIVLAIKPQIFGTVLPQVVNYIGPQSVVLSVAAGQTLERMAQNLGEGAAIVRSIPNLPAEIGRGITTCCANAHVSDAQRELCETLLKAVGEVAWITDESLIDAITAVSGSGPAYVFLLAECLAEAGRRAGLPHEIAEQFARATVTGAGELLLRSPLPPSQLRENVTSPNGTTAAALAVLMHNSALEDLMAKAVAAAAHRSRELSE